MKNKEFSKTLLIQESILLWILNITFLVLAFICIYKGFTGSLPWLTAMISLPWAAYGVSQACYYNKAAKENTSGGIKYETTLKTMEKTVQGIAEDGIGGSEIPSSDIDIFGSI